MTAKEILKVALRRKSKLATSRLNHVLAPYAVMIAKDKSDWDYRGVG
jgi:hypothetical protein